MPCCASTQPPHTPTAGGPHPITPKQIWVGNLVYGSRFVPRKVLLGTRKIIAPSRVAHTKTCFTSQGLRGCANQENPMSQFVFLT